MYLLFYIKNTKKDLQNDIGNIVTVIASLKSFGTIHESFFTLKSRNLGTPSNLFAPKIILFLGSTGQGFPKQLIKKYKEVNNKLDRRDIYLNF